MQSAFQQLDYTLSVHGVEIRINKQAIAELSPVFQAMWNSQMRESKDAITTALPDDDPKAFQDCLDALLGSYIIEEEEDIDRLLSLMRCADKFEINRLAIRAITTAIRLFESAEFSGEEGLKQLSEFKKVIDCQPVIAKMVVNDLNELTSKMIGLYFESILPEKRPKEWVKWFKPFLDDCNKGVKKLIEYELNMESSMFGRFIKGFPCVKYEDHESVCNEYLALLQNILKLQPEHETSLYQLAIFYGVRGLDTDKYKLGSGKN